MAQKLFYGILVAGCLIPLTVPFLAKDKLDSEIEKMANETKTTIVDNETMAPDMSYANIALAKVKETPKEEPKPVVTKTVQVKQIEPEQEIVYDGMTLDALSNKLNKSLGSTLSGKGALYASYSLQKGVDPYVAVAITLQETGCSWNCSKQVRQCNNVGGMKGSPGCNGTSYKRFNTIDDGIKAFIDNLSANYYKKGLNTVEKMNRKYASSSSWGNKVNMYINKIKSK